MLKVIKKKLIGFFKKTKNESPETTTRWSNRTLEEILNEAKKYANTDYIKTE
jgi:hypothetical protein